MVRDFTQQNHAYTQPLMCFLITDGAVALNLKRTIHQLLNDHMISTKKQMERNATSNLCKRIKSNRLGIESDVMIRKYNQLPDQIQDSLVGKRNLF